MMKIKNKLLKISYLAILLSGVIGLSGCVNQNNPNPDGGDTQKEWVDFVNSDEVKLTLEYSGHNFFDDGISEVKLKTAIDGDTAHFLLADGSSDELIKIRFYGIDTPESTGKIQEYGKAASNFTKEKLTKANENGTIVISSPYFEYKAPETDSTGGRYLGLVWINETKKNASIDELRLLNLEIVQNGYSWVKNLEEIPEFVETFTAAEQQARDFKLNLFSGEKDPLFNYGDYIDVSLLELKKEVEASLKDPNHVNKFDGENVRIQGTVAGYADNILYLQGYFDEETGSNVEGGEYGGINIFTGMGSIPTKFITVNNYIQLCGVAQDSENFGFQISGVYSFPRTNPKDERDGQVIFTSDEIEDELKVHVFEYKAEDLVDGTFECLFSPVTISDNVVVSGGYNGDDSITLYVENMDGTKLDFDVYIPFIYRPEIDNPILSYRSYEDFVGKTFKISNSIYSYHKTTSGNINYQLIPINSEGFSLVEESE